MKLTRDKLKQIIKEELEELMQVDEVVDERQSEYKISTLEDISYNISQVLRGQGSAGIPQSIFAIFDKIKYPPRNVDFPGKIKDAAERYFLMQKSPQSFLNLKTPNISFAQQFPQVITDIVEFFFNPKTEQSLQLYMKPEEKAQYLKTASFLEYMIKTATDMIKRGESKIPPLPTQGGKTPPPPPGKTPPPPPRAAGAPPPPPPSGGETTKQRLEKQLATFERYGNIPAYKKRADEIRAQIAGLQERKKR